METRKPLIIIILLFTILLSVGIWRHNTEYSQVYRETLPNGLDVIVLPSRSPLVSIQLWVRTGSFNETLAQGGISHYLEHMLFKNKACVQNLENMGGAMNGATSHDFTYYYVTLPSRELTSPIHELCELVFLANFTPTEAIQEKKVILEEISRSNDAPDQKIYDTINSKAYGDYPYARKVLGTPQTIKGLTYTQLREYYKTWYVPNNSTLVISGKIDRNKAIAAAKIASKYTPLATPAQQQRNIVEINPQYRTYSIPNLPTPRYTVTYSVPGYGSNDTYALDVLTYVLSQRTTALLSVRLKEELDLIYAVSCDYETRKYRSLFTIDCYVKKPYALSRIRQEIENCMQKIPLTAEDLELAKTRLIADHFLAQESAEQRGFGYGYYNTIGDYTYEQNYIKNIQAVTIKDINKITDRYFRDSMQFVFLRGK